MSVKFYFLSWITCEPVNEMWLWPSADYCQRNFFLWLIQWDDPACCNRPALPWALFCREPIQEQQAGSGGEEGKGRPPDPFDKPNGGWVEGTRFIWLFQGHRQVTWPPRCTETFFVCTQLWEVNKVPYPVFGNRVGCTAWQPLRCF